MRIAHISDLHFTSFFKENNLKKIRYLLKQIIKSGIDHIVISGDLTDNANREDFLILRKLFDELDLLHHDKLSLVIGNHDIFGGVQTAEDIFTSRKHSTARRYLITTAFSLMQKLSTEYFW